LSASRFVAHSQTDALLERAINLSVGVVDPGLGSAFGISIESDDDEVDKQVEVFRGIVEKYL